MTEKRKPWMKFYPADWQADEGLRQCSLTSRGLWIEMIAVMHKSAVYGHLLIAGFTPTEAQIAAQVSSDAKTVKACIAELESWGVFSRTPEGIIFSRRMLEDARKEKLNRENGSGGGNPALRLVPKEQDNEGVNPPDNRRSASEVNQTVKIEDNGGDKAQRLEARKPEEERKPFASLTRVNVDDLSDAVALWNEMAATHGLSRISRLTDVRKRHLRRRLDECGGIAGWRDAMRLVTESPFLLGQRGEWKADFDFVLQPSSFAKIMEGTYGNRGSAQPKPGVESLSDRMRRSLEEPREEPTTRDIFRPAITQEWHQ